MYQAVLDLLESGTFPVVDSIEIPGRDAMKMDIPRFLFASKIGSYLKDRHPEGLWAHQSKALEALGEGENVVVSTGTASGKSLIFQALTLHKMLLDPSHRAIVFYPLRALIADQYRGWEEYAAALGINREEVVCLDRTTTYAERESIIGRARVVIMTPDLCHAWLMSHLAEPSVRTFLAGVSTIVIDEAHSMESVFGSNCAFLLRRLNTARNYILGRSAPNQQIQYIGATATIENPGDHLNRLTGANFTVIDHDADGAPRYHRVVAHVASAQGAEFQIAKEIQTYVLANSNEGTFITFADSRRGVERLVIATERDLKELTTENTVAPYRAGYSPEQRRTIEERLRNGKLRGVVSTSALELGIDISHLTVGLNVGLPLSRKSYRQRLGRVGRNGPGAFIIVGPVDALSRYGSSLQEYNEMSVEPSYLYLDNRFMQFAHARCLSEERDSLRAPSGLPERAIWPSDFADTYPNARPGGNRPLEFDAVAELGGDSPHYNFPLRNIGELNYDIKRFENSENLGEVTHSQALRECYPGGTYIHNAKAYKVTGWRLSMAPYIQVRPTSTYQLTDPQITTWINAELNTRSLMGNNLQTQSNGLFDAFLVECQMLITERVGGYKDNRGRIHLYKDLQQRDANMKSKTRNFRTSGVILCIEEDWFKDGQTRRDVCDRLREVFLHEHSIDPKDIGSAATNIAVRTPDGKVHRGGCIAIYDQTYGSLRLTEKLFNGFPEILDRLKHGLVKEPGLLMCVEGIRSELAVLSADALVPADDNELPSGALQVFSSGSIVCYREKGQLMREVEVIRPTLIGGELFYHVYSLPMGRSPVRSRVRASRVEPCADSESWDYAVWNVETEEYEEESE